MKDVQREVESNRLRYKGFYIFLNGFLNCFVVSIGVALIVHGSELTF
jgi:hypothetical protein